MSTSPPICLFVYNRPEHTRKTVEALLANHGVSNHDLIVFSDAAKNSNEIDLVDNVRTYLTRVVGFRSITIHRRSYNFGLAKSIVEGISNVLEMYDQVIVLEDDMITSPYFLTYMNEGLSRYANEDRVISISGYVYPVDEQLPEAFFLPGADCWGWGTWRRGWKLFNPDGKKLLSSLKQKKLIKEFNFNGAYDYSGMLEGQINGENNSWAIRWYASAFIAGKLTLYPGRTLVNNIGNDGSGTHCGKNSTLNDVLSNAPVTFENVKIEISYDARRKIQKFFIKEQSLMRRFLSLFLSKRAQLRIFSFMRACLPAFIVDQLRNLLGEERI